MANSTSQFDVQDITGETRQYVGTVDTVAINLPPTPVADKFVSEILFNTQELGTSVQRLLYSFDGGVTFNQIKRNTILGWFVRGQIQQIQIKSNTGTINYDIVVNLEDL